MGDRSKIEWTDASWNPVRGCSVVSAGCKNCYAMQVAARFSGTNPKTGEDLAYTGLAYRNASGAHWTGKVRLIEEHLDDPLRWKMPRRIFVNSMSDLFHESIPDEWIDRIFAVMATARRHAFQILTKRPRRMREYMQRNSTGGHILHVAGPLEHTRGADEPSGVWPRPNIWLGVSCEDQKTADERIPLLLETPAAVRFISAEPLLSAIDVSEFLKPMSWQEMIEHQNETGHTNCESSGLSWVIVGGESGAGARPFNWMWADSIIKECKAAGVPVFMKQYGSNPVGGLGERIPLKDKKGGDWDEWPDDLRVREFPEPKAVAV